MSVVQGLGKIIIRLVSLLGDGDGIQPSDLAGGGGLLLQSCFCVKAILYVTNTMVMRVGALERSCENNILSYLLT